MTHRRVVMYTTVLTNVRGITCLIPDVIGKLGSEEERKLSFGREFGR